MLDGNVPEGVRLDLEKMPSITKSHNKRLRSIWSYGRPVHLAELTGIELDLVVHGLIETLPEKGHCAAVVTITKLGLIHLNNARQSLIESQKSHHELGSRLSGYLRSQGMYTWENVEFCNESCEPLRSWSVVRPDVFACLPSLKARNAAPAIYEVKVSRSDFLADISKPQKREAYRDLAEAVYYCCEDGLIGKEEIPDGFGLVWETKPGEFAIKKKAKRQKNFILSTNVAMTLMVKRQVPLEDISE